MHKTTYLCGGVIRWGQVCWSNVSSLLMAWFPVKCKRSSHRPCMNDKVPPASLAPRASCRTGGLTRCQLGVLLAWVVGLFRVRLQRESGSGKWIDWACSCRECSKKGPVTK